MSPPAVPLADRFWQRVDRGGPDDCWPWLGYCDRNGYGKVGGDPGTVVLAHRAAFALHHGREPVGILRHTCDNPPCCNPAHHREGTQADNVRDMDARGRRRVGIGERHGKAQATEADVRAWRAAHAGGETCKAIAERLGIPRSRVADVIAGRTWRHVA